jgi:FKBP-type peptidyl-prolyl cis-trans isomerase
MSGLAGLFAGQGKFTSSEFKYDAKKSQKKAAPPPQQTPFPFQSQIHLFQFDSSTNSNKSVGSSMFLIRPSPPSGHQLLCYQNQNSPHISLHITSSISFQLRDSIYAYLTDSQNIQWTIQFPDASSAARASVTIGAVASQSDGKKLSIFDVGTGTGNPVSLSDDVVVSYFGFLAPQLPHTGTQFDNNDSYSFTIGSDRVIKGYSAGVDGMRVSGSRVVIIPPELGYGMSGAGSSVPGNATLAFLITLKSAQPSRSQTAPEPSRPEPSRPQPAKPQTTLERLQRSGAVAIPSATSVATPRLETPIVAAPVVKEENEDVPEVEAVRPRRTRELHVMTTVDEDSLLEKMDALADVITAKFDAFTITAPATMKPSDVIYEVESLVAEIEEKERQLQEQKQIIDEMTKTNENVRLRTELDIAQNELQSMRSAHRGERDHRAENDRLKGELRRLRERRLSEMESNLAQLRSEIARKNDVSQEAASKGTQEMFYGFIGSIVERIGGRLAAGNQGLSPKEITGVVFEVFNAGSEELMRKVEENGFV